MRNLRIFGPILALAALALVGCSRAHAATYSRPLTASFGIANTGKATNLTYRVIDTAGTTLIAATGTGITESPAGSGNYFVAATWDSLWTAARVEWLDSTDALYAVAPVAPLPLDMSQAVPMTNLTSVTTSTLGAALSAARAQGAGAWSIVGATLTLKNPDGTTFRTFTLSPVANPTSRN